MLPGNISCHSFKPAFIVVVLLLLYLTVLSAQAQSPEIQSFDNEEQRELFLSLTKELRCPKCQNQNIADSNSQIAIDLRNSVARLVRENQSEKEIKEYMVNRYGEFVLYEPPLNRGTVSLWFGPVIMGAIGLAIFLLSIRARKKARLVQASDAGSGDAESPNIQEEEG